MGFPVDVENEYIYPPHGHILSFYNIIMVLFMCGPLPLDMGNVTFLAYDTSVWYFTTTTSTSIVNFKV